MDRGGSTTFYESGIAGCPGFRILGFTALALLQVWCFSSSLNLKLKGRFWSASTGTLQLFLRFSLCLNTKKEFRFTFTLKLPVWPNARNAKARNGAERD